MNSSYKLSELSNRQRRRLKGWGSIKLSHSVMGWLTIAIPFGWIVVVNAIIAWKVYNGQDIGILPEIMFGGGFLTCCMLPFFTLSFSEPDPQYFDLLRETF